MPVRNFQLRLPRRPPIWIMAVIIAVSMIVLGAVPIEGPEGVLALLERIQHIMIFLVAITVVSELAQRAGLFEWIAEFIMAMSRGHVWAIYVGVCIIATATTIVLGLDATAVLVTPVALVLARRTGTNPFVFAMVTVWLANTGSLLLPVSNLTNLLAVQRLDMTTIEYVSALAMPALVAILLPSLLLAVLFRSDLGKTISVAPRDMNPDMVLAPIAGMVVICLVPAFLANLPVDMVALSAALVLAVAFLLRRPTALQFSLIPWRLSLTVVSLFIVMDALGRLGGDMIFTQLLSEGSDVQGRLQIAVVASAASNLMNNLPTYLLLERAMPTLDTLPILALLIGVNVGSVILPFGSLATILWWERCNTYGVKIDVSRFIRLGLFMTILTIPPAIALL